MNVTSHITRRHITYLRHIWGTSSTAGGNNSRHICQDVRFLAHRRCPLLRDGSEQTRVAPLCWPRGQHWILSCVHLDYLLIAAVYTLITFVRQVIDIPLLQSPLDGHPYTLQPTIYLSTQSQPSTYMAHEAGSCNIPDMSLQR